MVLVLKERPFSSAFILGVSFNNLKQGEPIFPNFPTSDQRHGHSKGTWPLLAWPFPGELSPGPVAGANSARMTWAGNQNLVIIQSWEAAWLRGPSPCPWLPLLLSALVLIRKQTQVYKTMSSEDFENGKEFVQIQGSRGDILQTNDNSLQEYCGRKSSNKRDHGS